MPNPTAHRTPRKRNANPKAKPKHKHPPPRFRNAGPPAPRPPRAPAEPVITKTEALSHLLQTVAGTAGASFAGAGAVKLGFHPYFVSGGLGVVGALVSWLSGKQFTRHVGLGAASAAGSQLLLMAMNPGPTPPKAIAITPPAPPQLAVAPTHAAAPVRPKNADLGSLPPGMLDAAFERARSELAVASDGYPHDYAHAHHHMT